MLQKQNTHTDLEKCLIIELVDKVKYLQVIFDKDLNCREDIEITFESIYLHGPQNQAYYNRGNEDKEIWRQYSQDCNGMGAVFNKSKPRDNKPKQIFENIIF